ncbi:helix-turn-helix domain-containing protein [Rothia sp. P5764]|uniref:helix-turn-helix domain-containing protein n=1 Tax=Rothia sp. P5764 TaxID=3402654 RepID=UPI003AD4FBD7
MNDHAYRWAWGLDLPATRKIILLALVEYSNAAGECHPTHKQIAERCGVKRVNTVREHLLALERFGLIERREHFMGGRRTANTYFLRVGESPSQGTTR